MREGEARSRVLYIEDNPANAMLMRSIFETRPDLELIQASSASAGVQAARRERPDLILLDLHLPDATGAEVLGQLRSDPATSAIPVVAVSADARDDQARLLVEGGAAAYVTKPFDIRSLLEVVNQALTTGPA